MKFRSKNALIIAASMSLLMAGCGKSNEDTAESGRMSPEPETTVETTEVTTEEVTATPEDAAQTAQGEALMAKLKELVDTMGVANVGTFEGKAIPAEDKKHWESVDFGYAGKGILSVDFPGENGELMLVYYIGDDTKINVSLYKEEGSEAKLVADMPLSYKNVYDRDIDFTASNASALKFGTEGITDAAVIEKAGELYLITEDNNWFVYDQEKKYYSDREKFVTADSIYHGDFAIYKITDNGFEGQYKIMFYCYGMDGMGNITLSDFSNKHLQEYRFGDLGENEIRVEHFMEYYNPMISEIGFAELTNVDEKKLSTDGVLGEKASWKLHWDCNTEIEKGDDAVRLEVADATASNKDWLNAVPGAKEAREAKPATPADAVKEVQPVSGDSVERYAAFFTDEYPTLDDELYLSANKVAAKYAYSDLDGDGADELLIGDDEGVFAVVTEEAGEYFVTRVCGWMRQYGAVSTPYLGNGCFATSVNNGNNYGGPFREDHLLKYDSKLKGCGVVAWLTSSWDPSSPAENLNCWDLYTANDETNIALAVRDDESLYTHDYIDYGKNYEFDSDGNLVKNDLMNKFDELVAAHTVEGAMGTISWNDIN